MKKSNWVVAKNWQMRNYLLFSPNFSGCPKRNWVVAYGTGYSD